jgi:hypothetical protein
VRFGFVLRFSGFVGLRWRRADLVFFCGVALEKSRFRVLWDCIGEEQI